MRTNFENKAQVVAATKDAEGRLRLDVCSHGVVAASTDGKTGTCGLCRRAVEAVDTTRGTMWRTR